ncbi:hypothetical protein CK203_108944 [Vitis vinifera]|uniref:Uncharacterized protein n=1 Tax=Vitis vinifera TaxID=29760 RepID=A0A438FFQ4_VITVI|nr:hypothetical protein CK203_108944 [Vitis vinifera]
MSFLSSGRPMANHLKRRPTPLLHCHAHIKGGHTTLSSREARPRASSPQDSSQAPQALTRPPTSPPLSHQYTTFHLRELGSQASRDVRHAQPDPQALTDSQRPSGIARKHHQEPMVISPPLREIQIYFYPRVAMDFYYSMTTQGAQSPTTIHFSIDGRQGILEARHISGALHIPYEQWI